MFSGLASRLESQLYGQHLAVSTVAKHVSAHMRNPNPTKALGLSFQGWTGTGKNYVSQILAKHIYKKGMQSKYVHLISATREFPHAGKLQQYKVSLDILHLCMNSCSENIEYMNGGHIHILSFVYLIDCALQYLTFLLMFVLLQI